MTRYLLLTAFVVLLTIAVRRIARRRTNAKWRRLFQDRFKDQYLHLNPSGLSARLTCLNLKTMGMEISYQSKTDVMSAMV